MGAIEEEIVRRFLKAGEGTSQNVEAMIGLVADDVEYRMNVPLAKPVRGREALRSELERQNAISTGILAGSELHHIASVGDVVFTERSDVFDRASGSSCRSTRYSMFAMVR